MTGRAHRLWLTDLGSVTPGVRLTRVLLVLSGLLWAVAVGLQVAVYFVPQPGTPWPISPLSLMSTIPFALAVGATCAAFSVATQAREGRSAPRVAQGQALGGSALIALGIAPVAVLTVAFGLYSVLLGLVLGLTLAQTASRVWPVPTRAR